MAYNMSFYKGRYPGEPGYEEWTGFEVQIRFSQKDVGQQNTPTQKRN